MSGFVCVYSGTQDECQCCGGWLFSVGEDGTRGPFTDVAGKRWCSEECAEDMAEFVTRQIRARATEWCPVCGFDRHEHAADCTASSSGAESKAAPVSPAAASCDASAPTSQGEEK